VGVLAIATPNHFEDDSPIWRTMSAIVAGLT